MLEGKGKLECGDVYLFHATDPACPPESSLWGMIDRVTDEAVYLEASTTDHRKFRRWHMLAPDMRFFRLSTRLELRVYMANMLITETKVY